MQIIILGIQPLVFSGVHGDVLLEVFFLGCWGEMTVKSCLNVFINVCLSLTFLGGCESDVMKDFELPPKHKLPV